jgi:hypothetical protein
MGRKTVEVGKLLNNAKKFLAAPDSTADGREAICSFIEGVLFETKNYEGYHYLDIAYHDDGTVKTLGSGSRRKYFANDTTYLVDS